jgi:hypothetical protein
MLLKIQTFFKTCVERIYNNRWPDKIRNEDLWKRAGQEPVAEQILPRSGGGLDVLPETRSQHHTPNPDLEPAGQEEKRQVLQQFKA